MVSDESADTAAAAARHAQRLARIRFVLVETSLSGNIGATARAMKNMGLARLALVRPKLGARFADADALARASGADDLLAAASVHSDLADALAGCRLVLGSSARARALAWPELDAAGCGARLVAEAAHGDVALVLGRESTGLSNDELACCHYLVRIPTNPDFSSLNIAAAAQVFAYEIRRHLLAAASVDAAACAATPVPTPTPTPMLADERPDLATAEAMEGFHEHLLQTLIAIGYADADQCRTLSRRLRRLFHRARPDRTELNILRGVLAKMAGRPGGAQGRGRRTSID
ncbi:RNA methyltransferase [uncultured Thiohalocapsa sp.]|uniref:RNA methyltransferase n=1 Tax=uncultured Thiohalocapsa sp. TaxID=768990 RepID=UPI0025F870EB|nr:RNA methyltransferase [uncultured Thiohalocapsa sp.]